MKSFVFYILTEINSLLKMKIVFVLSRLRFILYYYFVAGNITVFADLCYIIFVVLTWMCIVFLLQQRLRSPWPGVWRSYLNMTLLNLYMPNVFVKLWLYTNHNVVFDVCIMWLFKMERNTLNYKFWNHRESVCEFHILLQYIWVCSWWCTKWVGRILVF